MEKFNLAVVFRVLIAIEGAVLIIIGIAKGANFLSLIDLFVSPSTYLSAKEMFVLIGFLRTVLAIFEMKPSTNRASMIVVGICLFFFSIAGFVYYIITSKPDWHYTAVSN